MALETVSQTSQPEKPGENMTGGRHLEGDKEAGTAGFGFASKHLYRQSQQQGRG